MRFRNVRQTITGALFRTAVSGDRIEIKDDNGVGTIEFYSGLAGETFPGMVLDTPMTSSPDRGELILQSPTYGGAGPAANINLRSGASDGSVAPEIILGASAKCFGQLKGDLVGDGARIRMRSTNELSFRWNGATLEFYVDGLLVKSL